MSDRRPQLAYSSIQELMLDEASRRAKGEKVARILGHFLGRDRLDGLRLLDLGSSGGIIAAHLAQRGARVIGADIDLPGLHSAQQRYGDLACFVCGSADRLPLASHSVDVAVVNHVYEHVVDPWTLADELTRVLVPDGVAYLGLQNRLGVIEPHYHLPLLSWLPRPLAHRYVRLAGRGAYYHERPLVAPTLRRLFGRLSLWDYTATVLAERDRFAAADVVPAAVSRLPAGAVRALSSLIPTFIWVGTPGSRAPAGPAVRRPPRQISSRASGDSTALPRLARPPS